MPIPHENLDLLHADDLSTLDHWHHEGLGELQRIPGGGMRLSCQGSRQGGPGCHAFFRFSLPDHIAVEYDLVTHATHGLIINYLAIRGIHGEDLIDDRDTLPPRTGVMRDYWAMEKGLQSYHVSFSRFNDQGKHTGTTNWRRNPGLFLVGHGDDLVTEIGRSFHIRITKSEGMLQFFVNDQFASAAADWATQWLPIPDTGKFGFRLIGADVTADVRNFQVYQITPADSRYIARDRSVCELKYPR